MKRDTVYLLIGEEKFFKDEFIKNIKNKFLNAFNKELNFSSFLARDSHLNDILAVARTTPFFSKKRVVVVKQIDKLNPKERDSILSFIKHPPETTCLILESNRAFLDDKFLSSVSKYATLIKTQLLSHGALAHWIRKSVSSFNKRITKEAGDLLRELAGNNLQLLSKEIEKVISFIGEKDVITLEDVEKIVGRSLKEDVFVLVDYISRKDISKALLLCKRLLVQGKKPHEIIGVIGWYLRKLLSAKLAFQRGDQRDIILKKLGLRHFYTDRFTLLLDNFKVDELKEKLKLLFVTDRVLKTTSSKPEFILGVLVSRLCAT